MDIIYYSNRPITCAQFIDILRRSTLAERRPVHDLQCIQSMLDHASILCTAWAGDRLVGVARSVSDFQYCCYLSDLAVDKDYQKQGIGKQLINLTSSRLGPHAKIILLSAPAAIDYYHHIGFQQHTSAWFKQNTFN